MKKILAIVLCSIALISSSYAKKGGEVNTHKVQGIKNVAIKGYDPVAYFIVKKPVKGTKEYQTQYNGATWFFSSAENKNKFAKKPKKFAPQYGGYCAFAVAVPQRKVDIDPKAWYVHKGKLYLNYTVKTQKIWLGDYENYIDSADENWSEVKKK